MMAGGTRTTGRFGVSGVGRALLTLLLLVSAFSPVAAQPTATAWRVEAPTPTPTGCAIVATVAGGATGMFVGGVVGYWLERALYRGNPDAGVTGLSAGMILGAVGRVKVARQACEEPSEEAREHEVIQGPALPVWPARHLFVGAGIGFLTGFAGSDPSPRVPAILRIGVSQEGNMDRDNPAGVFARLYALISGPAEEDRDWVEVRDLFYPDALLKSELTLPDGSHQSGTWTVEEFCEAAADEYRQNGFWECEVSCRSDRFGHIAQLWSTYESRIGSPESEPVGRGINAVQLLRRKGEWRIASLIFQVERGTDGIPEIYLQGREERGAD